MIIRNNRKPRNLFFAIALDGTSARRRRQNRKLRGSRGVGAIGPKSAMAGVTSRARRGHRLLSSVG